MKIEFDSTENFNWGLLIFGVVLVLVLCVWRVTENTKELIKRGYVQQQIQGSSDVMWVKR